MGTSDRRFPSLPAVLRRHWAVILIITLTGLGAGYLYAWSLDRTFTSSSIVLLNPVPANPLTPDAASGSGVQFNVALETEAEVVATPAVAEGVSERLGRLVPDEGEFLDVEIPAGTQMVRISFTTSDPASAREGAQAFAEVFLEYREDRAENYVESSLTALQAEVEEVEEELRETLSGSETAGAGSLSARQVDLGVDRLAALSSQISVQRGIVTDPGRVLQPASEPSGPNELDSAPLVGAAGMLALAVGVALAWYREWRSGPVVETAALEVAGVPVFAAVPASRAEQSAAADDAVHEAYRHLRAGVTANALRPHTLAVCGVGADQHAPVVASNLAAVLAEARYSVLLIAADPEDRTVGKIMDLDRDVPGLADVLAHDRKLTDVLIRRRGMTVLPAGRTPRSVRELYAGPRFRNVLDELRGAYDFIILATAGTASAVGDGVTPTADSVLLVVTSGTTTHVQVGATLDRFERLGVRTMGAVGLAHGTRAAVIAPIGETTSEVRGSRVSS